MKKPVKKLNRKKVTIIVAVIVVVLGITGWAIQAYYMNTQDTASPLVPVSKDSIKSKDDLNNARQTLDSVNDQNDQTDADLDELSNS